jgi:hypothetical protein
MLTRFIIITCALLASFSCKKDEAAASESAQLETNESSTPSKATVMGPGMDCGDSWIVAFEDSFPVQQGAWFVHIFQEINLPDHLKIEGIAVNAWVRSPTLEEGLWCTFLGPTYAGIYIIHAERR